MNQIKSGKSVHAYLFVGSRGTGKTTTARILAKALNCTNLSSAGDPCNSCAACKAIKNGSYMDLIEIDAASNRGIDDIRELKDKIKLAPAQGKQKIYIIDEVHMLTNEAFNALLKTLEEPPAHATFILCTTESHKVPETIKSRCQVFSFKRATKAQLIKKLKAICDEEKAEISNELLMKIADLSSGGFRDAETVLQQVVEGSVDLDSLLVSSSSDEFGEFLNYILVADSANALRKISKLFDSGIDLYSWTSEFLTYLRMLLHVRSGYYEDLLDVTTEQLDEMRKVLTLTTDIQLVSILEAFVQAQNSIKSSFIPQLPLEICTFKLCHFAESETIVTKAHSPKKPPVPTVAVSKNSKRPLEDEDKGVTDGEIPQPNDNPPADQTPELESLEEAETAELEPSVVPLEAIVDKWDSIIESIAKHNSSIKALLKACKPIEVIGSRVCLEVAFAFHKERLESPKNRSLVEKIMSEILAVNTAIFCTVSKEKPQKAGKNESGVLTDFNVAVPMATDSGALLSVFDGGLPL